ncbi:hypothetical protein Tsubulata_033178, partial [Turnera subulata]
NSDKKGQDKRKKEGKKNQHLPSRQFHHLEKHSLWTIPTTIPTSPRRRRRQRTKAKVKKNEIKIMQSHTRNRKPATPFFPHTMRPSSAAKTLTAALTPSRFKDLLLIFSFLIIIYLFLHSPPPFPATLRATISSFNPTSPTTTTRRHLLFSIASSASSFPLRKPYIRLWYTPETTRAYAFLDGDTSASAVEDPTLPPVVVSGDTSRFPYTLKGGLRSAIRVARVVKEAVELNETGVRWFVFGDDDTVFVVENLVKTLAKYDHRRWVYVGSNSETYEQNEKYSFDMAFGGGGFALSYPLGRALARVLDSCLYRYAHLYGSDARIFSCLAELGVSLTHEPGFHQVDMRGNLFGILSAHPLSPLVSLHHLDAVDPLFPNMNKLEALHHFFKAVDADPARILQQSVCYDREHDLTISVAWGYSVQVTEGNILLPDLLFPQKTFSSWRRGSRVNAHYMFITREYPRDPCKRSLVFFMESVASDEEGVRSSYTRHNVGYCSRGKAVKNLKIIRVLSRKLKPDSEQMKTPRRHCCYHLLALAEMRPLQQLPPKTGSRLLSFVLLTSCICVIYILVTLFLVCTSKFTLTVPYSEYLHSPTTLDHVVFGIASSQKSWPKRKEYVKLWWKKDQMRGCVFLETSPEDANLSKDNSSLPPVCISEDTSRFRYTFKHGLRSAIRVARVVKETVELNHSGVRWYVFGDDDTVLAKTFDSCIERYPHLYGSDSRVYSCLQELGVGKTHEPGFHQTDLRGDLFGLLASHPLTPLVSLHHFDLLDPIFPNMTTINSLQHLFKTANVDSQRLLQKTICYDRGFGWTISVSWGYAVEIYGRHMSLPDVLPAQETFKSMFKRKSSVDVYLFNTREPHPDPCRRPTIFFLDHAYSSRKGITSHYKKSFVNCSVDAWSPRKLEEIKVFSQKLDSNIKQLQAPRRHCCDVLPSYVGNVMEIAIRECGEQELVYMH